MLCVEGGVELKCLGVCFWFMFICLVYGFAIVGGYVLSVGCLCFGLCFSSVLDLFTLWCRHLILCTLFVFIFA